MSQIICHTIYVTQFMNMDFLYRFYSQFPPIQQKQSRASDLALATIWHLETSFKHYKLIERCALVEMTRTICPFPQPLQQNTKTSPMKKKLKNPMISFT